jgi:hypothetical protein
MTNILKEFTRENATIHVTASSRHRTGLDIKQLDVVDITLALPCGMLKYHWDKRTPTRHGSMDSPFELAVNSSGEDGWVEVFPRLIYAHLRWDKFNEFNLYTLEEAWIVGLL